MQNLVKRDKMNLSELQSVMLVLPHKDSVLGAVKPVTQVNNTARVKQS